MEISVLDKGFVRLQGVYASDLLVANAARVSFAKRSAMECARCEEEIVHGYCDCDDEAMQQRPRLKTSDSSLIKYLLKNRHGTPFEHNFFSFHVKLPIFVTREWHRHRTGWSYNEWSGRYSKLEPEWYVPARDDIRHQVGKPGAYTFERVHDDNLAVSVTSDIHQTCSMAFERYEAMLDKGIAKEVARLVLPVNTYTQMHATCNARSLMHFLGLRNSPHAQKEIREYAKVLEALFAKHMPVTHAAFIDSERKAP